MASELRAGELRASQYEAAESDGIGGRAGDPGRPSRHAVRRRGLRRWIAGSMPLGGIFLAVSSLAGCGASLEPRVEEGTIAVGVVHDDELHASRGAYTRLSFGNPPPHFQVRIEETQIGSFGKFSLDLDQEGSVRGTVVLGDRTLSVVDASPIQKEGKASTMVLTVAPQNAASRVVPAELVAVGWPDRGRWFRRFGKPLARAAEQDRMGDVPALKAEFRSAMARELATAKLAETPNGFQVSLGAHETTVDLQRMLEVTTQGSARVVVSRLAALARYKLERPVAELAEGTPSPTVRETSVFCALGPEGPFTTLSRAERDALVSEPVAPGIVGVYIFDYPDHFELMTQKEVGELGLASGGLASLAAKNLFESVGPIYRIDVGNGIHVISSAGFFDASLLLVPEIWAEIDPLLAGDRVVAVPDRDTLMVTGANNSKGVEMLVEAARLASSTENPVAGHLLVWRSGKYERSRAN